MTDVRDTLVPRIKHVAFGRTLRQRGIPDEQLPLIEPLAGELEVTYAFDLPDEFVMASPVSLRRAGISIDEVRPLARANLRSRLGQVETYTRPGVELIVTGGELEACLLLLDSFWADVEARREQGFVVCAPRRNRLLISQGLGAESMDSLLAAAKELYVELDDGHALSLQMMVRRDGGWKVRGV